MRNEKQISKRLYIVILICLIILSLCGGEFVLKKNLNEFSLEMTTNGVTNLIRAIKE